MENIGKAAADAYLDMFPQDLLDSNKRVRPINVRIIEHDGFIDYEIEFVELSDEYDSDSVIDTGHDNKEASDKIQTDSIHVEVTTQKIATTVPVSTTTGVTAVTFIDLLMRARRKHRQNVSQEEQKNRARTSQPGTSPAIWETTESSFDLEGDHHKSETTTASVLTVGEQPETIFQRRNRVRNENVAITRKLVEQRRRISQQLVPKKLGDAGPIEMFKLAQRFMKTGRSTTFKPAKLIESMTSSNINTEKENELQGNNLAPAQNMAAGPIYKILSSANMPSDQESMKSRLDSDNTLQHLSGSKHISGMSATSEVSRDIHPTTDLPPDRTTTLSLIEDQDTLQNTEYPGAEKTTTLSLIEELKRQLITISYDLSEDQSAHEDKPPTTTLAPGSDHSMLDTMYQLEDLQISESRSVADLYSEEETLTEKSEASEPIVPSEWPDFTEETNTHHADDALTSTIIDNVEDITELPDAIQPFTQSVSNTDYETMQTETAEITTETQYSLPERSPKRINSKGALSQIIEDSTDVEGLKASQTVLPNEVIKDSYQEANPGQYHEMNPGQYHEVNPGQYHESSPGQYHETHPGQYHEKHPGQDLGVENVTVDFDHTNESRTYNVKASAGDFIIGEVGRIDINSGQTLEGVRYTAVEGEVDQARIADILERYFGARAS
eukprot:GFUD01095329.1.p1 GENE.GFUD01095329.1~~GFUD01095329.1.p1  ORF type:complete len:766 (-),score=206.37 GFUD01095329.1:334-2337(-)